MTAALIGRYWRVDGSIFALHTLSACGFEQALPELVSGSRVDRVPPVAKPGKKVTLSFASRETLGNQGSYWESSNSMTIRPG